MGNTINKLKFWHYLQGGFLYRVHCARLRKVIVGALIIAVWFTSRHGKNYKKLGLDNTELLAQLSAEDES